MCVFTDTGREFREPGVLLYTKCKVVHISCEPGVLLYTNQEFYFTLTTDSRMDTGREFREPGVLLYTTLCSLLRTSRGDLRRLPLIYVCV